MIKVVGVRFKKAGKVYYFEPGENVIELNHRVIVETARGVEYGEVVLAPKEINEEELGHPVKSVIRLADEEDALHVKENELKAKQAFQVCLEKIEKHKLPMKLVDVEYTFDNSKLIFYFTSDGRVDFRELVKDLAAVFRTRIELRQIGVRDEARMLGGLGSCGRSLCCATFLGDFEPVSIRMAKEQNLSLNPNKISGICGRLMCCLKYESDLYKEAKGEPSAYSRTFLERYRNKDEESPSPAKERPKRKREPAKETPAVPLLEAPEVKQKTPSPSKTSVSQKKPRRPRPPRGAKTPVKEPGNPKE